MFDASAIDRGFQEIVDGEAGMGGCLCSSKSVDCC